MNLDFLRFEPDSKLHKIANWIQKIVVANILWILFSLLGLGILGIMPATAALFSITLKWNKNITNFPLFKTFWRNFKSYFIKANLLGLIIAFLGYLLIFNFSFYQTHNILYYISLFFILLYVLILIYIFPLLVNYELKLHHIFKNAILISFLSPKYTLQSILGVLVLGIIFLFLTPLIPFFAGSSIAFFNMWSALKSFSIIENKVQKYKNENNQKEKQNKE